MSRAAFWRVIAIVVATGLLATAATASKAPLKLGPDLLTNSGFEAGLAGWTTNGFFAQGFDFGIDGQAHSGSNAFFGGAIGGLGFLSQSIATTPGRFYDVSLWLASDGFLPNEFRASANGAVLSDRTDILLQGYTQVNLIFLATAATTNLQFGFQNDSGFLHVDDIVATLVPEPTTLILLAAGLGAMGHARRRFG